MAYTSLNFTVRGIKDIPPPPEGQRHYYRDTRTNHLTLVVNPSGVKTFQVYRKLRGRPVRVSLGRFPDISIEQARRMAEEVNAKIAQGVNPNEEKRSLSGELTLAELYERYMEAYAKPHKKSWKNDEENYRNHLSHWRNKPLSRITPRDISALHTNLGKNRGHVAANRTLGLISTMFNKAIEWGWKGDNPAKGVKKFREVSRDRFLRPEEMPQFLEALQSEPHPTFRDFFFMLLYTGARRGNVMAMRWQDIAFDEKIWRIPDTKNNEPHLVPLPPQAIDILAQRKQDENRDSVWVFPSNVSRSGHIQSAKKVWHALLDRAGIEDLRMHDLRRTVGSWQAAMGESSYVIGKTLGHKSQAATAIYARLNLDPVRESLNRVVDAMHQVSEEEEKDSE